MLTRRQAMFAISGGVVAACGRDDLHPVVPTVKPAPKPGDAIDDDVLDEALAQLHAQERAKQGLSSHAPMVAETLCVLGQSDRVKAMIEAYDGPMYAIPEPSRPIDLARWRDALGPNRNASSWEGEVARFGDWRVLLEAEIKDARWQDVLDRWVARLAPGLGSAATHGVIRTSHAARALGRKDTAPRRAELVRGLAYWAAAYEELPRATTLDADPVAVLARVPLHTEKHGAAPRGNIVRGLRAAAQLDGIASIALAPRDVDATITTVATTFARVFVQHAGGGHAVAFAHAITGPCALRRIAPHVSTQTANAALAFAWPTAAAIYAAYAKRGVPEPRIAPKLSRDELVGRAIERGTDHAIKLTETLLAEHALHAEPVFLAAAEEAAVRL